jgi:diadenosine tetraphosphatase ApaH/serine/threonine PP2A family protein phosphatase
VNDRLSIDLRHLTGPFDVIGDVHACLDELSDLFGALGYVPDARAGWRTPEGRTPVFVGDFVDRGPANVALLRLVMRMIDAQAALAVPGNHDLQLERHLSHGDAPLVYGLAETVAEVEREPAPFQDEVLAFLQSLPGHLLLDEGRLVVAHTGLAEAFHGVDSPSIRRLAAYGVIDGEMDPGDPAKRHPWVRGYAGTAAVVYGHTSVAAPVWRHGTVDIDTGCVFGWRLTALRWPERTTLFVPARRRYARTSRRFHPGAGD